MGEILHRGNEENEGKGGGGFDKIITGKRRRGLSGRVEEPASAR